jgi:hypothetical protein
MAAFQIGAANCQYSRWLVSLALASPAILLPQFDAMGLNRVRYTLGWPVPGMSVGTFHGVGAADGLHFNPSPMLVLVVVSWTYAASLGWRARRWAMARPDWLGALVQATLTSFYCGLVFCFLHGLVQVIWNWRLQAMQSTGLERALTFGRAWLPYLYALGAAVIFTSLLIDARLRRGSQRLIYGPFAFCFGVAFYWSSPYLDWQLTQFDWLIQSVHEQQR